MNDVSPLTRFRLAQTPKVTLEMLGSRFAPPLHKATILRWERSGIPAERVLEVERITGVSRHQLRPDLFGEAAQ
jgi:hypothetical protein